MSQPTPRSLASLLGRYLLTGGFTSLLDLALFSLLSVGLRVAEIPANVVSTIVTICVSYLINRAFVFGSRRGGIGAFFSFASVTLVTGLLLQSLVILGVLALFSGTAWSHQSWTSVAAKVVAMAVGAGCNFLAYRVIFTRGAATDAG